jgi:prevent-host-death family protein
MIAMGAFAAKAQFSALLERVACGEEVVITKHGRPVAKLVPAARHDRERAAEAVRRLRDLARGSRLDGLTIRELRDDGRL